MKHTIEFDAAVTYTGAFPAGGGQVEGVSFLKNGQPATGIVHITDMATPQSLIEYDVTYADGDVIGGDVVVFGYDYDNGQYTDGTDKLDNQSQQCVNCAVDSSVTVVGGWTGAEDCA